MPETLRIWEISDGDQLHEIRKAKLGLEERIEAWVEKDVSILADDLLVIGRQVTTAFGGSIDLLCLDRKGDLVIVELKRNKTPREVTAQALDYASWVKDLSNESITTIANAYLNAKNTTLEEEFYKRFGFSLPESINIQHRIIIVASEIDDSTERIIKYLSETYGVRINSVTFDYFRSSANREILVRKFLIDSEIANEQPILGSKRKPSLSLEQLEEIAIANGVGELYSTIFKELTQFLGWGTSRTTIQFISQGKTLISLIPPDSTLEQGLKFRLFRANLANYLSIEPEILVSILPACEPDPAWGESHDIGFFQTQEQVHTFLTKLNELRNKLIV